MDDPVYLDPDRSPARRADDLLDRMTLEQKAGQLLVAPADGTVDEAVETVVDGIEEYGLGQASPFGREGAPDTPEKMVRVANAVQEHAVEETDLGIPLLLISNAVHGNAYARGAAVFPHNLGLACARDEALVERMADATATELAVTGAHQNYSPVCDVGRDQRWGRIFETFGESPRLVGRLSAAKVRGYQGEDVADDESVLATVKHFPAYGEPLMGEDGGVNELSDSTYRRFHLAAHERAVTAGTGAESVMPCYNAVDGFPVHGTREYLADPLAELGFDGFVVSDHHGTRMLVSDHETARGVRDATAQSLDAGMDAFLDSDPGDVYADHLVSLVEDGVVAEADLDERVRRILEVKFRLGLFEDPYVDLETAEANLRTDEHRELALEAARKSVVLLDNDGTLPLVGGAKTGRPDAGGIGDDPTHAEGLELLVTGPTADNLDYQFGGWSSTENDAGKTVREAFAAAGADVTYREGATVREPVDVDAAAEAATDADAAVVCVGEPQYIHEFAEDWQGTAVGEFPTRNQLSLPPAQRALVAALAETDTPTIVVLISGRPLAITGTADLADAVLFASYPGSQGGRAIAEIVTGAVDPSGALSVSVPRSAADLPCRFNHLKQPDVIGPDFHPDTYDPLYPFGHGESYTDFEVRDLSLSGETVGPGSVVTAEVTVENVGDRAGATALDCYLTDDHSSRVTPVRELADFTRVALDPGESTTATFAVHVDEFGVLGADGRRRVEPGNFTVRVADCEATFTVEDRQ